CGRLITVEVDRAIIFPSPRGSPVRKPRPPPRPGLLLCRPSRAGWAGDVSRSANAAGFGARHHKEAGSAMEPAKLQGDVHDSSLGCRQGSATKLRSGKAEHRTTPDRSGEHGQSAREFLSNPG